jgi:hypothetical protein
LEEFRCVWSRNVAAAEDGSTPDAKHVPGGADASFFSLSSHKEERVGERRLFGTPLSGSLPARASRGEREPGFKRQFVISLISTKKSVT